MKLLGFYILSKNVAALVDFYRKVLRAEADGEGSHFSIRLPDGNSGDIQIKHGLTQIPRIFTDKAQRNPC